jgi:hypothetical protein
MAQVLPNNCCCAVSFCLASGLLPDPQLEHVPSRFNLHTSQLIPQAPVGMVSSHNQLLVTDVKFPVSVSCEVLHLFNWFDWFNSFDWFAWKSSAGFISLIGLIGSIGSADRPIQSIQQI